MKYRRSGGQPQKYARALVEIATREASLEPSMESARKFLAITQSEKDLLRFWINPLVPFSAKGALVDLGFSDVLPPLMRNFVKTILRRGSAQKISDIFQAFIHLAHKALKQVPVLLTVSRALPATVLEGIQKQLEAKLQRVVVLQTVIDPSVIGGVRLTWDGKVLDGTIPGRLKKMEHFLLRSTA